MLNVLRLQDWKSFGGQRVELAPLSLLIGPNASGKSNFLDAIRFLQGLGRGLSIEDILRGRTEGGRVVWPGIRGGLAEATRHGAKQFTIESTWKTWGSKNPLVHSISCRTDPEPFIFQESLKLVDADVLFNARALAESESSERLLRVGIMKRSGNPGKVPNQFAAARAQQRLYSLTDPFPATRSVMGQVMAGPDIDPGAPARCRGLQIEMRRTLFLEIMPSRMRDYVPRSASDIGLNGENISAVLFRLCQDAEKKQDLIDWLSELCAPELADIDFIKTELDDVMLVLVEKGGNRLSARSLSDGTLRFLGELVAMLTAPPDSLLIMEEIENGLHPARAHLLVQEMESATRPGRCQILATTHSPLILQALSPERLGEAIVFGRPPDAPGTVMKRLKDLPHFQEILERRGIENLFTTKWLERAL